MASNQEQSATNSPATMIAVGFLLLAVGTILGALIVMFPMRSRMSPTGSGSITDLLGVWVWAR